MAKPTKPDARVEAVVNLSKRRGFVFPSSEIYGGTRSAWDYGPLGVELKENIRRQWWQSVVRGRDDVVGLDSSVILAPQVWEASGHVNAFVDPLTECKQCHKRWRADTLLEAFEERHGRAGHRARRDRLHRRAGRKRAVHRAARLQRDAAHDGRPGRGRRRAALPAAGDRPGHLRQLPQRRRDTSRKKPPFGIGQTGKSFRNEITPGNFIFRTREFEQMEMEFFVKPGTDEEWHEYWIKARWDWYVDLGMNPENMRFFEHPKEKLSHYSKRTVDIEYRFTFGGLGVRRAGGHRQPDRLRPEDALGEVRHGPSLLRPG